MITDDAMNAARTELESAVKKWLKVKAAYDDEDDARTISDDPVMLGWILIATYTSTDLERIDATATAYDCPDGQPAPFSRGIAMAGVDRWSNGR